MKQAIIISAILGAILFSALEAFSEPEQIANDNKGVIALQKSPASDSQKQEIKQNKFCIIIQINGKIKSSDTADNR